MIKIRVLDSTPRLNHRGVRDLKMKRRHPAWRSSGMSRMFQPKCLAGAWPNTVLLGLMLTASTQAGPYDTGFQEPRLQGPQEPSLRGLRVKLQPDGKIIVHGSGFDSIDGVKTGPVARFNPDGTLDATFAFNRDYDSAFSVAPLSNEQMIINARLRSVDGTDRETVLRVNADGSVDNSFNAGTGADANIRVITPQPDGKILVGGLFTSFNGSPYQCVVRLNSDGSIDSTFGAVSFSTNSSSPSQTGIWAPIIVQPDGKILLGGVFATVNGISRDGLVRLNTNGTVDTSFVASGFSVLNGRPVRGLGFQRNGMLIAGGRFGLGAATMVSIRGRLICSLPL